MKLNVTNQQISLAGAALGVTSLCYSVYSQRKFKKDLVNKISDGLYIEVSSAVVDEAIGIAVEREVSKAIKNVSERIYYTAHNDIHKEVKLAVDNSFTSIKTSVSADVAKEVANIDMRRLKRDVEEKAKEMIVEKFDGNLDSLLTDFNNQLSNVSKIYASFADSISKKNSEATIKIGI